MPLWVHLIFPTSFSLASFFSLPELLFSSLKTKKKMFKWYGIVHLVHTQNFPKNYYFLPPDTRTYVRVPGVRNVSFSENFANVVNE